MIVQDKNFVEEWKDIKGYEGKYQVMRQKEKQKSLLQVYIDV